MLLVSWIGFTVALALSALAVRRVLTGGGEEREAARRGVGTAAWITLAFVVLRVFMALVDASVYPGEGVRAADLTLTATWAFLTWDRFAAYLAARYAA